LSCPSTSNKSRSILYFIGKSYHIHAHFSTSVPARRRCGIFPTAASLLRDGLGTSDEVLARQFRLHLHRGIGHLATPGAIKSIADLIRLADVSQQQPQTDAGS
jgi:hypothetical protein